MSPVRRAGKRDLDRVTALWIALTEYHASLESLFALRDGAEDEVRRIVDAQLHGPDTALFVHDEGPTLAGLCVVRVDRAPPVHAEVCRGEITDLFVREEARRRGIGRALAETAVDWARERGALRIEVRVAVEEFQSNPASQTLHGTPAPAPRSRLGAAAPWALAGLLGLALVYTAILRDRGASDPAPTVSRWTIPLPPGFRVGSSDAGGRFDYSRLVTISPDGSRIAFAAEDETGEVHLFLRDIGAGEVVPVVAARSARGLFFSPDGA